MPGRRVAVVVTVGVLALIGGSTVALSSAQAYPLHFGRLAANKVPRPGERLTVSGSGFVPGSRVEIVEVPGVHHLAVVRANAAGFVHAQITLPKNLQPGTKYIEGVGAFPRGGELILRHSFVVRRPPARHRHPATAIQTYVGRHPAPAGVAGGGALAALSGGGLLLARRRRPS